MFHDNLKISPPVIANGWMFLAWPDSVFEAYWTLSMMERLQTTHLCRALHKLISHTPPMETTQGQLFICTSVWHLYKAQPQRQLHPILWEPPSWQMCTLWFTLQSLPADLHCDFSQIKYKLLVYTIKCFTKSNFH